MTYAGNNLNHSSSITLSNCKDCLSFSRALLFETCERKAEFELIFIGTSYPLLLKIGESDRRYSTK